MKGTIIGSDLLQSVNSVKVIEVNTNTTIYNDGAELLDYDTLFSVLIANSITELHFIYTAGDSYLPTNADSYVFEDKLKEKCLQHNITYYPYVVPQHSVTVPYIEDAAHKFILRQSFDTTALVDETYCADKFEFVSLMSGSEFAVQSYVSDISLGMDTFPTPNISNIDTPNAVVKARYPNYNNKEYPAIYELDTLLELSDLKANIPTNYLIQEFVYDSQNIDDGRWNTIRSIDIMYGPNLDIINLGGYKCSTIIPLTFSSNEFVSGSTTQYNQKTRYKYITKQLGNFAGVDYHIDDETMILDYTGSLKDINTIKLGDYIQSIDFTDLSGSSPSNSQALHLYGWNSTLQRTIDTLVEVSSSLNGIASASVDTIYVKLTLDNGLMWDDAPSATYYIEESGSLSTRWEKVNNLYVGDKFVVKNTLTNQLETVTITSLEMVYSQKVIYGLDFEPSDLFLVDIGDGLFGIMHNGCWGCGFSWCGSSSCSTWCPTCQGGPPPKL